MIPVSVSVHVNVGADQNNAMQQQKQDVHKAKDASLAAPKRHGVSM